MDCLSLASPVGLLNLLAGLVATTGAESRFGAVGERLFSGMLAQAQNEGVSWSQLGWLAGALAVLVLPFFVGGFIAKRLKMPNHSVRIGFVLFAITASAAVLLNKLPEYGVDLRGGTILVYEIDPSKGSTRLEGGSVKSQDLVGPLTKRINPSGTREILIRPYGDDQIEIIIPEVDQREVAQIEETLEQAGILRFAIVANQTDHQRIIELAAEQAESPRRAERLSEVVRDVDGRVVGRWVVVDRETKAVDDTRPFRVNVGNAIVRNPETGEFVDLPAAVRGNNGEYLQAKWVDENNLSGLEVLMIIDPDVDVTGEDLAFASTTYDEQGAPAVAFTLTDPGSGKFRVLTTENAPQGTRQRQLGIVMDDRLLSAPNILQPISKQGRITGNFTTQEVRSLVDILKAGQLPAALTKHPIAKNQIDATLGADTISKGIWAIGISLGLVLLFILVYYQFAGVIACIALLLNLAMILATMVLINQPLTLPGLAGLVLTVGMSVDANVLIFERIREELKKGAKDRMAVRNGFGKATITIVDANLTTLFTAIVLYAIGTDQIRGFAVTLILGILFSMFTAIYMSRTFFDIAERHNKLRLSMADWVNNLRERVSGGAVDFMSMGKVSLSLSAILIVAGVASLVARGSNILDIDFAGGSSVQFRVSDSTSTDEIRRIVGENIGEQNGSPVQFTVNGVTMEDAEPGTVFKVDSSLEAVEDLQERIVTAFKNDPGVDLVTYNVQISPAGTEATSAVDRDSNGLMLVAAQADEAADDAAADTADGTETASGDDGETTAADAETETDADTAAETDAETDADTGGEGETETLQSAVRRIDLGIDGSETPASISGPTLIQRLKDAAESLGIPLNERAVELDPIGEGAAEWSSGSSIPFSQWQVSLPMNEATADRVMGAVESSLGDEPIWVSSSSVGARVAGQMIGRASVALFASLMVIILYIWFRFQRVIYGFAAVAALVHDILVTLGAIAISYYVADALGFLLIDPFKISLTVVAALLTIIGYSLNDTIVIFDRIRETKGKAPRLTGDMINTSINNTLSRTLLTSLTTLIVVLLLYAFGGEGIHAFAFALVVGVLVGTYSSVFVASPILLWLVSRNQEAIAETV